MSDYPDPLSMFHVYSSTLLKREQKSSQPLLAFHVS